METPKAKKWYFAYGSNCNLDQMVTRCPKAKPVSTVTLPNYILIFNGVASIRRKKGAEVLGVLWEITPECEQSLDRYEGFPRLYGKKKVTVYAGDGSATRAMVYVMVPGREPGLPSTTYYEGIKTGFLQNGIPTDTLEAALAKTRALIGQTMGGRENVQPAFC
jgi:gamma-glutamylcyclotransferase (GGCT)/AIG2-like uncharacterized protein YtfP